MLDRCSNDREGAADPPVGVQANVMLIIRIPLAETRLGRRLFGEQWNNQQPPEYHSSTYMIQCYLPLGRGTAMQTRRQTRTRDARQEKMSTSASPKAVSQILFSNLELQFHMLGPLIGEPS
jgi:hypothetical protein